jgi:hypothetical protein
MAEIYADLPSPQLDASGTNLSANSREVLAGEPIQGLRSALYAYQRRSVAAMIEKEMSSTNCPDPLYTTLVSMDGQEFYFQPGSTEVLRERPVVPPSRGGILCEELGT